MSNLTTDGRLCIVRELKIENDEKILDGIEERFALEETCKWILANNFLIVCLQFPDELLYVSTKIYEEIQNRVSVDLYILGDTSYASCCVDAVAAMHVQGNAVVHYGHSCLSKSNIPVFTVLPKRNINVDRTMQLLYEQLNHDSDIKICLFYDADLEHCKDDMVESWFLKYPQSCVAYVELEDKPNKFLGRIIRNKFGEEFPLEVLQDHVCVYIGSRGQTLFNYTISVPAKNWCFMDPDIGTVEQLNETAWFKRRRYLIEKCKDARVVGILICKLAGDQTKEIIARMKQLCKASGRKSYIVSVGKPNVAKLANFPEIDIYVMIACPENDLYSSRDFYRPIVYPFELEVALNAKREAYYTSHVTDYDDLLPGRRHYCDIEVAKDTTDVSLITGMIRETKIESSTGQRMDLAEKQNWALETIGMSLQGRSWTGLEQNLGKTEVKTAETGRKGIPLQYNNEPEY